MASGLLFLSSHWLDRFSHNYYYFNSVVCFGFSCSPASPSCLACSPTVCVRRGIRQHLPLFMGLAHCTDQSKTRPRCVSSPPPPSLSLLITLGSMVTRLSPTTSTWPSTTREAVSGDDESRPASQAYAAVRPSTRKRMCGHRCSLFLFWV